MPNSLRTKLLKLRYKGQITNDEYAELINKLDEIDLEEFMKKEDVNIKSCPFCGEKPIITVNLSRMYTIGCKNKNCFIQPHTKPNAKSKEELCAIWNFRINNND